MSVVTHPQARAAITISQLPTTVNLILYAGDDFTLVLAVKEADGSNANLAGASALSHIRQTADAPVLAGEFQTSISGNEITLHLAGNVSAQLPRQTVWDCEIVIAGRITTLVAGTIQMTPEVTREVVS